MNSYRLSAKDEASRYIKDDLEMKPRAPKKEAAPDFQTCPVGWISNFTGPEIRIGVDVRIALLIARLILLRTDKRPGQPRESKCISLRDTAAFLCQ